MAKKRYTLAHRWRRTMWHVENLGLGGTARLFATKLKGGDTVRLRPHGFPESITMRVRGSDEPVLRNIFVERDCDFMVSPSPKLIIDGGANVGYSTLFLARAFPGATVVAVEPDSEN